MEERNENLSFNDEFRFKNKPDETTPKSAENMNVALDNTSYLKRELDKMNVVLKNMVITHEFTIFQGNQTFSDLIDDTWLCQCYSMKQNIEIKFPLKQGYKRTAVLCVEGSDNKDSSGSNEIVLTVSSKDYRFYFSKVQGNLANDNLEFYVSQSNSANFNNIPNGHAIVKVGKSNGKFRIDRIYWLITDTPTLE